MLTEPNIRGRVVFPSDPDWDAAHEAFNTRVDQRPVAMVFPAHDRDVVTIVNYARERRQRIAPQAPAPNAPRIATSRCRDSDRARRRFATLTQAISSRKKTAPNSMRNAGRTLRTVSSLNRWLVMG